MRTIQIAGLISVLVALLAAVVMELAGARASFAYFSTSNRDGRGSPRGDDDRILRIVPE